MKKTCALITFGLVAATAACSDNRDTRAEREAQMAQDDVYTLAPNTPPPQIPTQPQTPGDQQQGTLSNGRGGSPNPDPTPPTNN